MQAPRPRSTFPLSQLLLNQLNVYALSATAAGVGVLALAQPAQGKIVYKAANITVPINTSFGLDLNSDGVNDLSFTIGAPGDSSWLLAYNLGTNGVVGKVNKVGRKYPYALKSGGRVDANRKFLAGSAQDLMWGIWASSGGGGSEGNWKNVNNGYVGVKFAISGQVHYGWVRITTSKHFELNAVITGYAYETVANKPIITGKTKSDNAVMEPASLGHLARGASALPSRRVQQTAAR
jgi:hypothetical protein